MYSSRALCLERLSPDIGLVYISAIATAVRWSEDRLGTSVGLTVMGFGFWATIYTFILRVTTLAIYFGWLAPNYLGGRTLA